MAISHDGIDVVIIKCDLISNDTTCVVGIVGIHRNDQWIETALGIALHQKINRSVVGTI